MPVSIMWLGKKCAGCTSRLKKNEVFSELRLDTAEGPTSMLICPRCADFWEGSAKVLTKRRKDEHMEETIIEDVIEDE